MPLTATVCKASVPKTKDYKVNDSKGLFLLVKSNGTKCWRMKYHFAGKEKQLAFGVYPEVALAEAREKRDQARKLLKDHIDPGVAKKYHKLKAFEAHENNFESIAREWHSKNLSSWKEKHAARVIKRLEQHIFPWLGSLPIKDITPPLLLSALRRIESRGILDTAQRIRSDCGKIFRYAIASSRAERDPAADLKDALETPKTNHLATITDPKEIALLLQSIHEYKGTFVTACALKLAPLFFVRPGELRKAEWSEFNFETAEWRIPAHKMKMAEQHIVPLSRQAIAILKELMPLTSGKDKKYVFPGVRDPKRPMSDNTVNAALRRLGYTSDEMTGHGFRSMASTILNEQGWNRDAIERQLAHAERNKVRAAYNYAEYLPERRKMMQAWSDYLDSLI